MKKLFFVKEYPIQGGMAGLTLRSLATIEVDFNRIESELPPGAQIKYESVQTVIDGGNLVVFGEYTSLASAAEEMLARESIDIQQVLGDQEILPSVN
jgi:hypothetical protein